MKSAEYARRILKGLLLLCFCGLVYFLSTGPAMLLKLRTESDSANEIVNVYLLPIMEIDYFLSGDAIGDPFVSQNRPLFHKTLIAYVGLYGEEVSVEYEIRHWLHGVETGRIEAVTCFL